MMTVPMLIWAVLISANEVAGYILGEGPDDANYMRCWQQGNLMSACPLGFEWSWNMSISDDELWYEGETYTVKLELIFSDEFRAKVVQKDEESTLINHLNVHSCKFDLGKVCIPFLGSDLNGVTHTAVITGEDHGVFYSSVSLTEGMWNVIAHGRLYLHDSTFYPLEGASGCDGDTSALPDPWKLDFAIGLPKRLEPPKEMNLMSTTEIAGWQIFMVLILVVGAVGVVYMFYRHYSSKEKELVKETAEQAMRKAIMFESCSLAISFGLATFDWVTDCLAMWTVQKINDLDTLLVILYFAFIIIITCFYFFIVYYSVVDILAVLNEFKTGVNDVIAGGTREEQRDAPMLNANRKSGKINYEFARVRRAITGEKVGSLMGVIEDIPMFCFNAYLIFHKDIDESMLMISFITNAVILGYKFSGIERLWYLLQIKTKIDSMVHAVRMSRRLSRNDNCNGQVRSRLGAIERALVEDSLSEDEGELEAAIRVEDPR